MTASPDTSKALPASHRRLRGRAAVISAAAIMAAVTGAIGTTTTIAAASTAVPHVAASGKAQSVGAGNPATSAKPSKNFSKYCYSTGHDAKCDKAAIFSIDRARRAEGVPSIAIPKSYYGMSVTAQLSFLANKERAIRHLPTMSVNGSLNSQAQAGAAEGDDPSGPSAYAWGSNIAWGYQTALAADFGWMYDDGPDSPNVACTSAGASGCWGHRENILANWSGAQGAGAYDNRGTLQLTQLFVAGY